MILCPFARNGPPCTTAPALSRDWWFRRKLQGRASDAEYSPVEHLLTRNLANQESDFDPDPEASAKGIAQHERFLIGLGYL